jgi:trehalose 6-phosphate synthase
MSRLIVISNRVSAPKARAGEATQGGLAMALAAGLRNSGGIWFGWSGQTIDTFSGQISVAKADGLTVATIDLEAQDVEEYYNGYANQTLWPMLHHRIDLAEFDRHFGEGYERVNERFAETASALIEPGDLVWVHDYHLVPLGSRLRMAGVENRIGFFLHVPWPPHRLMASLPYHRRLVESMFAYDLIGFQSAEWLENFRDYLRVEVGVEVGDDGTVALPGRTVRIGVFPIGVDVAEIEALAASETALEAGARLRRVAGDRKVIIGVDRLDYSKGIPERFLGYQHFLENRPDEERRSFLLQVAPLSRDDLDSYAEIRGELDGLSGRINGALAHVDWIPIHYVNRSYPRDELAGLYREADVALVTPLRDGMNLVAKEYVAAQDPRDPGVLVLSRFAGAAEQLTDALLVNPHSKEEVADALQRAMAMSPSERQWRWQKMMESVRGQDVHWWLSEYLAQLGASGSEGMPTSHLQLVS